MRIILFYVYVYSELFCSVLEITGFPRVNVAHELLNSVISLDKLFLCIAALTETSS